MKLLENYLVSIKEHLPIIGRESIVKELRSLLLDEIEDQFGENPTDKEVIGILNEFGNPEKVASQYRGEMHLIPASYTKLYMLVTAIVVGAMFIAFTVVFIVGLLSGEISGNEIFIGIIKMFGNVIMASVSGIGFFTVFLILYVKLTDKELMESEELSELNEVLMKNTSNKKHKTHNMFEVIITIVGSIFMLMVLNFFPEWISNLEDLFLSTGLTLGHRINVDFISQNIILFNVGWTTLVLAEILYVRYKKNNQFKVGYDLLTHTLHLAISIILVFSTTLYMDYTGVIGFKLVFIIALVVNIFELIGAVIGVLIKKLESLNK